MDIEVSIDEFWKLLETLDDMASDICDLKDNQSFDFRDIKNSLTDIEESLNVTNENLERIAKALEAKNESANLIAENLSAVVKAITENQKSYISLIDFRLLKIVEAIENNAHLQE